MVVGIFFCRRGVIRYDAFKNLIQGQPEALQRNLREGEGIVVIEEKLRATRGVLVHAGSMRVLVGVSVWQSSLVRVRTDSRPRHLVSMSLPMAMMLQEAVQVRA